MKTSRCKQRKNWHQIKETRIKTFFFLFLLFIGCSPKTPKNIGECLVESNEILEKTKEGNFSNLKQYLDRKNYLENYELDDLRKAFSMGVNKLKEYGVPNGERVEISVDTILSRAEGHVYNPKSDLINVRIVYSFPKEAFVPGEDFFKFLYQQDSKGRFVLTIYEFNDAKGPSKILAPPPK